MKFTIKWKQIKTKSAEKLLAKQLRQARKDASAEYAVEFKKRLNEAISRQDLSIAQLEQMDHPYARRHGKPQVYGSLKDFMVHERTGNFKGSFSINTIGSNQYVSQINVEFNPTTDSASAVFYGTKRMLPRNPVQGVAKQMQKLDRGLRIYKKHLKKVEKNFKE